MYYVAHTVHFNARKCGVNLNNYWMHCHEIWYRHSCFPLAPLIGQNFNLSNTSVSDQIPEKTKEIPISLSCTYLFSTN